jgi:hypothetical protein
MTMASGQDSVQHKNSSMSKQSRNIAQRFRGRERNTSPFFVSTLSFAQTGAEMPHGFGAGSAGRANFFRHGKIA